jgi:hypothetical protein
MKFTLILLTLTIGLAGCSGATVSNEPDEPSATSSVEAEFVDSSDLSLSDGLNLNGYSNLCASGQFDSDWEGLYEWASKTGFCVGPTSWLAAVPDNGLPSSWNVDLRPLDVEPCKILNFDPGPNSQDPTNRAFPLPSQVEQYENFFPKPDSKLLIAGVVGTDSAPAEGTPASDYAADGQFIQQWVNGMNDFGDDFEVHFSPGYLDVGGGLKDFGITHSSSREKRQAFADDVLAMLDEQLNLDIWDGVIIVTTPGTPRGVIEQAALPWKNKAVMTIPPKTYTTRFVPDFPMIMPMWVIHELGHVGSGLDDPNGSNYYQNRQGGDSTDLGMAGWGLQSTSLTDRLGWNKWITGFMRDEQVICADPTEPASYAIKASSIVTTDEKIIVIPLSDRRVLVLESIRATGLNYKLQPESEGLLIYEINTEDQRREHGARLLLGSGRQPERDIPLIVPDAPLKAGESIVHEGITIRVLEAADHADWVEITSG